MMRRSAVTVAGGLLKSVTVNCRENSVPTGAFMVSIPHPDRPFRNVSWPGQLKSLHDAGGQDNTWSDRSPSSRSDACTTACLGI